MPAATRSGNPAKKAPAKKTTTRRAPASAPQNEDRYAASAWGSQTMYEDLTVPSGQLCMVKRPGVEGLMRAGILHSLDSLQPLVAAHGDRVKGTRKPAKSDEEMLSALLGDPQKLEELLHLLDRITTFVVVKPDVLMTPNDPTSRDPKAIYADMIDMDDKLFIMNYAVGGTRDLERFRQESEDALGRISAGQADGEPTE